MISLYVIIFVQIVGEVLPISSSSHVYIVEQLLMFFGIGLTEIPDFFDYFLHGPMMLILPIFFRYEWCNIFCSPVLLWKYVRIVFITTIITGIFYAVIKVLGKNVLVFLEGRSVIVGMLVTAMLLFSLRWKEKSQSYPLVFHQEHKICGAIQQEGNFFKIATVLGLTQGLALLPGISRLASTYVVGLWLDLSPEESFKLSFIIQFPLIVGAFFIKGLKKCISFSNTMALFTVETIVAMCVATVVAYGVLYLMWRCVQQDNVWKFGWYLMLPISILTWLMVQLKQL
jgi:undecaprenyl-diphosphatase